MHPDTGAENPQEPEKGMASALTPSADGIDEADDVADEHAEADNAEAAEG
jgi:hypothetical protein